MRPVVWSPPVEPSAAEQAVIKAVQRARLFVFLRRHGLSRRGSRRRGWLATILQAYTRMSDDEVIETTVMDRRWQLALDCLSGAALPFSQGTLVGSAARRGHRADRGRGHHPRQRDLHVIARQHTPDVDHQPAA
jgi:hypothetical protein